MKKALFGLTVLFAATAYANWLGALSEPSSATIDGASFYEISSPEELAWFAAQVNAGHSGINAVLKKDIVFFEDSLSEENAIGAYPWTPIAYSSENAYSGVFDGADHKIVGVHLEDYNYTYATGDRLGFFGHIGSEGIVKNVSLEMSYMDVNYQGGTSSFGSKRVSFGALAGRNEGVIQNVFVGGLVKIEIAVVDEEPEISYGSGVVGENFGSMENVVYTGTIVANTSSTNIGGIVGYNAGPLDSVVNKGVFILSNDYVHYVGGIAYRNLSSITNSENHADIFAIQLAESAGITVVSGDSASVVAHSRNYGSIEGGRYIENYFGGIAAYSRGKIEYCENYGNLKVFLASATGCVMGSCLSGGGKVGGIVGYAYLAKIDRNTNYGNLTVLTTTSSYAGSVPSKAGGVVGHTRGIYVTNNRNFGDLKVTGSEAYLGTIVAQVDSSSTASTVVSGNYSVCDTSTSLSYFGRSGIVANTKGSQLVSQNFIFKKMGDEGKLSSDSLAYLLNKWVGKPSYGNAWSRGESYPILAVGNRQPSFLVRFFSSNSLLLEKIYTDSTGIIKAPPVPPEKEDSVFLGWRYSQQTTQNDLRMLNLNKVITNNYDLYAYYGNANDPVTRNMYTFYNDDGSLMWSNVTRDDGSIPYPTNLKKSETPKYTYSFDGWLKLSEFEYQATFDSLIRSYEIKFYQGRKRSHSTDSLIYTATVEYGQMPEFKGVEPSYDSMKTSSQLSNYVYSFSGNWKPALVPVTGAATYRAIMDSVYRKYEITFFDYDSVTVLEKSLWEYNSIPQYEGEVPVRAPAGNKIYEFSGWKPQPTKVTKATSYYAKYDSVKVVPGSSSSAIESCSSALASSSSAVVSSSSEAKSSSSAVVSSSSEAKSSSSVVVSSSSEIESSSSEGTTGVNVWQRPQFSLQTIGRNLQISGANPGFPFAIMDLQGSVVLRGITTANFEVTLPRSGSYLVRIDNNIARVNIR